MWREISRRDSRACMMTTLSTVFLSSRTLPGQEYDCISSTASGQKLFRLLAVSRREMLIEVVDQQRHVLQTFAQRRQLKRNHIQTIKKIRAEVSLLDLNSKRLLVAAITRHRH